MAATPSLIGVAHACPGWCREHIVRAPDGLLHRAHLGGFNQLSKRY
jgi:hypothetical protein